MLTRSLYLAIQSQYEQELARMMQVKADNMAIFIQREREDIASLWDALYYSDVQRGNFTLMDTGMYL